MAHPHSGWINSSASGSSCDALRQLVAADGGMDVTLTHPNVHVAPARLTLNVRTEELIGQEQYLAVGTGSS